MKRANVFYVCWGDRRSLGAKPREHDGTCAKQRRTARELRVRPGLEGKRSSEIELGDSLLQPLPKWVPQALWDKRILWPRKSRARSTVSPSWKVTAHTSEKPSVEKPGWLRIPQTSGFGTRFGEHPLPFLELVFYSTLGQLSLYR